MTSIKHKQSRAPKKPSNKNGVENNSSRNIKISPSLQSLAGVFVLAFGLAAIAAVGYLAYVRMEPTAQSTPSGEPTQAQYTDSPNTLADEIAEQPQDRTRPDAGTLDKAGLQKLRGNWVARNGSQIVFTTLRNDNTFEILVFLDRAGFERRYSSGTYTYEEKEGVLTLRSSYAPLPEMEGVSIKTLTRRTYNIIPLFNKKSDTLIWVAQHNEDPSYAHPIFSLLGRSGSYIAWSPNP
jgi:hypothetical protein